MNVCIPGWRRVNWSTKPGVGYPASDNSGVDTSIESSMCGGCALGPRWRSRGLWGIFALCRSTNLRKKLSSMSSGMTYGGPWMSPFCMSTSRWDMVLSLSCCSHSCSSIWSWSARASLYGGEQGGSSRQCHRLRKRGNKPVLTSPGVAVLSSSMFW